MNIIINVTCAEIQSAVGFLYVIQSVVLNQTLNADCEQSWYSQSHFRHVTIFRVRNETAATPNSDVFRTSFSAVIQKTGILNLLQMKLRSDESDSLNQFFSKNQKNPADLLFR
ncbi:hypothetical protein ROHU_008154 [Labeo rohita]|uniref:Uncharacterized protein n=1 Tax=Labeo rohita TaxID=84645 RepID=A0A498MJB8_LABRO|nr:hypothetical protein ROHU_008154 [Labeo rohita]